MLALLLLVLAATRAAAAPDDRDDHDDRDDVDERDDRDDRDELGDDRDELGDDGDASLLAAASALGDPGLAELAAEAGELADLPSHAAIDTGVTFASSAFVDAAELRDAELRHRRPSRWGRLDLALAWRRAWDVSATRSTRDDALWLVATWRR